jgi:hypothetical protein
MATLKAPELPVWNGSAEARATMVTKLVDNMNPVCPLCSFVVVDLGLFFPSRNPSRIMGLR